MTGGTSDPGPSWALPEAYVKELAEQGSIKAYPKNTVIVQEGVPDVIPAEACYLGWQESLEQLAKLVDPEIPD